MVYENIPNELQVNEDFVMIILLGFIWSQTVF